MPSCTLGKLQRLAGAQLEDDSVGLLRLPGAIRDRPGHDSEDGPADAEKAAQHPGHCIQTVGLSSLMRPLTTGT